MDTADAAQALEHAGATSSLYATVPSQLQQALSALGTAARAN